MMMVKQRASGEEAGDKSKTSRRETMAEQHALEGGDMWETNGGQVEENGKQGEASADYR